MFRRDFLALTTAALVRGADSSTPLVVFSEEEDRRMGDQLRKDTIRQQIFRRLGELVLDSGPWSVTFERPKGVEAVTGPHDYYSEGPYWWPNPDNPGGPYIRRDGERNPDRFMGNRGALGEMSEAVLALGMAGYFLGESRFIDRAAKVLDVWFLNAKTRMNPHLEFGQAIRGRTTGRGIGIIDTNSLIYCVVGAALAGASGKMDASVTVGLREWYSDYLKWITTSEKGRDEKKTLNNHATWWTVQAAAYAAFTGNAAVRKMAWDHYRNWLIPQQVQPDGNCPREEERTRSLSYSAMNLDGFALICRLGQLDGEDLWHYRTPKGIGIEKSFHYLMPFVLEPGKWKKQQITAFDQDHVLFPGLAGLGLGSDTLLTAYRKLPRAEAPWIQLMDLLVRSSD